MNKHEYIIAITDVVASKATCPRASVGAVFVNDDYEILSTGYNGTPKGMPHCTDIGCNIVNNHCIATTHAEMNAIVQAAKRGTSLKDSILYCTHSPCFVCAKLLVTLGVKKIFFKKQYFDANSNFLLTTANIELIHYGEE